MHQGYHSQLKRDDRMASLGLDINAEVRIIYIFVCLFVSL